MGKDDIFTSFGRFTKEDIDQFMLMNVYMHSRTLYIGDNEDGDIDAKMAAKFLKGLHVLESTASGGDKPINIIMNCVGGSVDDGMAMYDAIQACKNFVTIKVYGAAYSMASIILQAADRRVMSPNSLFMMHYGSLGLHDHVKNNYQMMNSAKKGDEWMEQLFLEKIGDNKLTMKEYYTILNEPHNIPKGNGANKKMGIGLPELRRMLDFDAYLSAEMALKLGLIDEVM